MFFLQLLKLLPMLIQMAEVIHPGTGTGPSKLNTVLTTVSGIADAVPALAVNVAAMRDPLTNVVNGLVGIMNASGAMKQINAANVDAHIATAADNLTRAAATAAAASAGAAAG